ncbi:MAG: chromate transporter [Anaerolineales bacterium]
MELLWNLFLVFARVALFSWGGGPASMGLMQRETVNMGWVSNEEFADALAVGNALPGPIAPQVSAYIGYKMAGVWGVLSAVTGTILPTTLLMMVMIIFFFGIKDSPTVAAMLKAVRPIIVGLLLWTTYVMAYAVLSVSKLGWSKALAQGWDKALIALAAFLILTFTDINPVWLVIAGAALGFAFYR